jgi:glycosyltransferase involved in cell wall biosynthesis
MNKIITTIPVRNGEQFIAQTLESVARQTLKPDRVVVIDNCSKDRTEEIVRNFKGFPCEFIRNPKDLGLFQNFNRCLEFADQTEYLQILHADDTIEPTFYEEMTAFLADCDGFGMAFCLDERIDENNQHLSMSGKADGVVENLTRDQFLRRKAEIGNQAFCATLLKTGGKPAPCLFPLDFPIVGDMVYWAAFGAHCKKIVHVHKAIAKYRWHGSTQTASYDSIQILVHDEWRAMEKNEMLRGVGWQPMRKLKLKGLLSVRANIKSKRVRQNGNASYSKEIADAGRSLTGLPLWLAGKFLVELRDFYIFKIQGRPRHPKNIYG